MYLPFNWNLLAMLPFAEREREREREREFFIANHLVRIHLITAQMILVDRPRAMRE
jgi:hypothetical protein